MFDAAGELDVAALDRALAAQIKAQGRALLFLNDPCHNPTGYSMTPEEWRAVVERLVAHAERRRRSRCSSTWRTPRTRRGPIRARS